jgi:glycosyltransferase involved in cell wall biosynthesis
MNSNRVSAIITTYNRSTIVVDAIVSVFDQSLSVDELILIDDGSDDDTELVVKKLFESAKIPCRYIKQENSGMANALLRGIDEVSGNWIAFLDDDDIWSKDHIQRSLEIAERFPDLGCVCGLREGDGGGGLHLPANNLLTDYQENYCQGSVKIKDKSPLLRPFFTPVVGAAMIKRELFNQVTFSPRAGARLDIHYFWCLSQVAGIGLDMRSHGVTRQYRTSYLSTDMNAPQEQKDKIILKRNSDEIAMLKLLISETLLPSNHVFSSLLDNAEIGRPYLLRKMGRFYEALCEIPFSMMIRKPIIVFKELIFCVFRVN